MERRRCRAASRVSYHCSICIISDFVKKKERSIRLAQSILGIQETAAAIVAEIGTDMSRFPSDKHLASWAGFCLGNKQSGGKRLSGAITKGNPHLRAILGGLLGDRPHEG